MNKHSPSPWIIQPAEYSQPWRVIFAPNAGKEQRGIIHVTPSVCGNYDDPRQVGVIRGEHNDTPMEVTEANAYLIAAAPDLLEAAEGLLAICLSGTDYRMAAIAMNASSERMINEIIPKSDLMDARINALRKAVYKAWGRESTHPQADIGGQSSEL
jgi:hypothetical protein